MIIIGEKINGSIPKVGKAIAERDEAYIRGLACNQTAAGADYLDCCASVDEDELGVLEWLIELIKEESDLPICIDSPDPRVCVEAMEFCDGRVGIINSVSGEGDKIDVVFPAIADTEWGCVALLSDDAGIPRTADDRIGVFEKIMERSGAFGIAPERLYIDPIVETLGANPESLAVFSECCRRIKEASPAVHITSGLSNISFGLPVRKMINMPFLVLAMNAGMDSAIMDPTNRDMNGVLHGAAALLGDDEFALGYIEAYRANLFGPLNRD